ncbi:hypothetical protein OGAPHI_005789 [Ogataea philodendri]|uniref:Uncharacterized protein n=1 Tax=Ogataea philodendri TaxID=1378263 RepID=A0A9P8NZP3_9ASCO|nr:uncharacterized protein OGAPHI_005789 [Ogataea philodendri]KAH3662537.1 hypothetical protein OGAPHI_005789 [Ogataea philodendri]
MSVSRHQHVDLLLCAGGHDLDQRLEQLEQLLELLSDENPHICGHLVVSGPAGVDFASNVLADDLAESSLVGGVNILVTGLLDKRAVGPLLANDLQTPVDLRQLVAGQKPQLAQTFSVHSCSFQISTVHLLVIRQRSVVQVHERVGCSREPAAPKS